MRIILSSLVASALLASGAAAADMGASAAKDERNATKLAQKKVCRLLDTTGTNLRERVCLTREEWKKVEEQQRSGY